MTSLSPHLFSSVQTCLSTDQRTLIADIQTIMSHLQKNNLSDYSFLVAPAAKAYEGYLKDFFLKIGIITPQDYQSDRFRVGKTLNPSLRYKRFSIFQKLIDMGPAGEQLAEQLWDGWKRGRNRIFHYFPDKVQKLTLEEAKDRIALLLTAIKNSHNFLISLKNYQNQPVL